MPLVQEISSLVKEDKTTAEKKKELEKKKKIEKLTQELKKTKPAVDELKIAKTKEKTRNKMDALKNEIAEIKGHEVEEKVLDDFVLEEKEPERLWMKKAEKKSAEEKVVPFREGNWDKIEKHKKENKMGALNLEIPDKPLYPEEPKEKTQVMEALKEHATKYKELNKLQGKKEPIEKKLFEKGVSEEIIPEKKAAEEILKKEPEELEQSGKKTEKRLKEDEEILEGFILEKPKKEEPKEDTEKRKKRLSEFQQVEIPEEAPAPKYSGISKEKRLNKLDQIIPNNPSKIKKTEEKADMSLSGQLGSIGGFLKKGITSKFGVKEVDKSVLKGLSKKEIKKTKKLISDLEPEIKKYAKEEIIEALQTEGYPQKIIDAVILGLYN